MARIPEAEIERLKGEISLERLVEAKGVKLKKHGENLIGLCPFHDDRSPSLVVTPAKNLWHCLGACQTGGTVIDWVMKTEAVSFRHAVELLREGVPSLAASAPLRVTPRTGKVVKHSTVRQIESELEPSADDAALLARVVKYYHETLKQSWEALEYLAERGLKHPELIEHFRLGFSNRSLGYRIPHKRRVKGAELRTRLEQLGIYRESGHEHMSGSLVIPVFDEQGRVTEMYGRKVTSKLRAGTPLHLYLPGPHRGVWNVEAFGASKEIIVCEALIDALTFWCAGFRNVTAAYGVEGFTEDHREALRRFGTERVLIAYDRDEAGDRAAERLAGELGAMGIECYRVLFPRGMDANEYALKVGPAEKSLGLVLRQAVWIGKGPAPAVRSEPGVVASAAALATESDSEAAPRVEREMGAVSGEQEEHGVPGNSSLAAEPAPAAASAAVASGAERGSRTGAASALERGDGDEWGLVLGDRRWRVRGLGKNTSHEQLRLNLLVTRESGAFHVDTIELYSARQRGVFQKFAADELGVEESVIKRDLGQLLLALEGLHERQMKELSEPKQGAVMLSEIEQEEALALLRDPKLIERIAEDFERTGVVGERTNTLVGYLAATSRKLDEPLAVVIQSSSAAGKSSLMDAVLSLMPEEERVQYSAMTGQSLFYMGDKDLKHRILAIVEEEGAEHAAYALKLLQSEGELTIASTGKDPMTGRLVTQEYRVEGPVMIFLTTTAIEVDEELLNRCVVLAVDEGREQTRAIHERQREAQTLEGLLAGHEGERIRRVHRNAQRLIRPLSVVNPYARQLRFLDTRTRTRRDHMKYLTLIRAIALLHQYQRPVKAVRHRGEELRYIEVTAEDIALANRLTHEVLGRSLDELPPQTRRLLGLLDGVVSERSRKMGIDRSDYRFSRREVREATGWSYEQLRVHLGRLVELEYLLVHRGSRGQSYFYELVYDGDGGDGAPRVSGLIEVTELGAAEVTTPSLGGAEPGFGVPLGAGTGDKPGGLGERSEAEIQQENGSGSEQAPTAARRTRPRNAARGGVVRKPNGARPPAVA